MTNWFINHGREHCLGTLPMGRSDIGHRNSEWDPFTWSLESPAWWPLPSLTLHVIADDDVRVLVGKFFRSHPRALKVDFWGAFGGWFWVESTRESGSDVDWLRVELNLDCWAGRFNSLFAVCRLDFEIQKFWKLLTVTKMFWCAKHFSHTICLNFLKYLLE